MTIDQNKKYFATIKMDIGDIKLELYPKDAPHAVNSFVFLSRDGYFDGVTFHRVIPDFMAQTGDPTGTGTGGPGYKWDDERAALALKHDAPGILSMANAGANTNGSQIFITYTATPHLNGRHAVFGKVTAGMDVLRSLRPRDPQRDRQPGDAITSIAIEEA